MVRIQQEGFDINSEVKKIKRSDESGVGALVTFVGYVRDFKEDKSDTLTSMEIEFYPGMTEKALEEIASQAKARWDIYDTLVIHRIGPLLPEDQIVLVVVTSAHRGEAFAACEFIMDYLKTAAPFWKKENTAEGARWVDARVSDDIALERWKK